MIYNFSFIMAFRYNGIVYLGKPGSVVMKELSLLSEQDQQSLLQTVEKSCAILLPRDSAKFGTLSFHLYGYSQDKAKENEVDTYFQIRWGIHSIYKSRHFKIKRNSPILPVLQKRIHTVCDAIRENIHRYCEEQLRSIVSLELEPQMQKHFTDMHTYSLGLCHGRQHSNKEGNHGWPNFCLFISWYDELDEFQEFLYPIKFDAGQHTFIIPVEDILKKFHQFRDTVL